MSETRTITDPEAACRRVLELAQTIEEDQLGPSVTPKMVAALMRVAVYDSAAVLTEATR